VDPLAVESIDTPSAVETTDIPSVGNSFRSSGGSGHRDEQAERDNEDFKADMAEMRGGLQQLLESGDRPERQAQIARLIARADGQTADADELVQAGSGQAPDRAFRLAAGHSVLADDIGDAGVEAKDEVKGIWKNVKDWMHKAGLKLWALISRLVKVKEWSISGTVGTDVLGFAQASISVTFGP
jgi:hypothetical protein